MLLKELYEESMLNSIKQKLVSFKGTFVSSMNSLLKIFDKTPSVRLTTIENFQVKELSKMLEARVDTGATTCAIDAQDIKIDFNSVEFTHEGIKHKLHLEKMKQVKNANGITDRAVVKLSYVWKCKTYHNIETTLIDRSKLKFKLLIGRNLIQELTLPVHINDKDLESE